MVEHRPKLVQTTVVPGNVGDTQKRIRNKNRVGDVGVGKGSREKITDPLRIKEVNKSGLKWRTRCVIFR